MLGLPRQTYRRKAVSTLRLRPGNTVVEIGCGTGPRFPLVEQMIGPEGRIIGVDLTDAMLAQAQRRVRTRGWRNVRLVQADALEFEFPAGVDAIVPTFALTLVPECVAEVVARSSAALAPGERSVVPACRLPPNAPAGWRRATWRSCRPSE